MTQQTRVVTYTRVSTGMQTVANQTLDLAAAAKQRGWMITREYTDTITGTKRQRPGLDQLFADAKRGRFDVVMVTALDRIARSAVDLLNIMDELQGYGVKFVSLRDPIDTTGPMGRAVSTIIAAISQLERDLIAERVRSGMRRAREEGKQIGRPGFQPDAVQFLEDRRQLSISAMVAKYGVTRTTILKYQKQLRALVEEERSLEEAGSKGCQREEGERPYFQHAEEAV